MLRGFGVLEGIKKKERCPMEQFAEKNSVLDERKGFILLKNDLGCAGNGLKCDTQSVAGAVSQRACVYCGARVVLNPITDAYHIVHGPIGCSAYTWDIRGSLSSDSDIYRNSFSTDLRETDVIFGGEKKLENAIDELVEKQNPKLIFVYASGEIQKKQAYLIHWNCIDYWYRYRLYFK